MVRRMTAIEYMDRQILRHKKNYEHEARRGAPQEVLDNIGRKIGYYTEAAAALRRKGNGMTNADWVRATQNSPHLTDEEIAENLADFCVLSCKGCIIKNDCPIDLDSDSSIEDDILAWLRKKREETGDEV